MDKGERAAQQHVRQVRAIWEQVHIEPQLTLKDLLCDQRVKHLWLQPFLQTCCPGTAKSYLGSLRLFLNFTMATQRNQALSLTNNMCSALTRLSSVLQRRVLRRRTEVEVRSMREFISVHLFRFSYIYILSSFH